MLRVLLTTFLLVLLLAPAAQARWFGFEAVDTAGTVTGPVVDLGIEEGGGVAYVKGGQAFLSRLGAGGWTAPAPLGGAGATEAVVATGLRSRMAAAWIQNGEVFGTLVGAPAVALSSGGGASQPAIEMGVNGVAYAVWIQNGDVRAARLNDSLWEPVPLPLDIAPANAATSPRVAVAADGSALVAWTEAMSDGRTHVIARRVYGTTPSALPQDATLPEGGNADSPEIDIEYDRTYAYVAFRQDVGGVSHTYARQLRASTFMSAFPLDAGAASTAPDLSMSSSSLGHTLSVGGDGILRGARLRDIAIGAPRRWDRGGGVTAAVLATSERNDSGVAWLAGTVVRGRHVPDSGSPRGIVTLGRGAAGPLSGSSNRIGDMAFAFVAGGVPGVAMYDRPPSAPTLRDLPGSVDRRVLVRWVPGQEFGGRQRYEVRVDGRRVARVTGTSTTIRLAAGRHKITVVGVDRRGQRSAPSHRQIVYAG